MVASKPFVVITGSSSGIGSVTALRFASAGYGVILHGYQNLRGLLSVARRAAELNDHFVLCITGDIRCARACSDIVQAAFASQRNIHAWINLAGADVLTKSSQSFDERLRQLVATDLLGTICISRLVAKRFEVAPKQFDQAAPATPCIVNIGWDQADLGMEGEAGQLFCTTKSAISSYTRALALSVAPQIRVNCVSPGWIQTAWGAQHASDYWQQRAIGESLLNRWGRPEDVAETIFWLCSDNASFINGQNICVNGGRRFFQK